MSETRSNSRTTTRILAAIGIGAIVVGGSRALLNFFGPDMAYNLSHPVQGTLDSDEFLRFITTVTQGNLRSSAVTRLKNGAEFYPAELEAIRCARHAINLEYYEFAEGEVGASFLDALEERARAGVEVRLTVDRMGSFFTHDSYFNGLRAAGGRMCWYHPLRWNTWQRADQRTHRKLLVVDGQIGFLGGAGIADHWLHPTSAGPRWRDSVFRVEGDAVAGLVATFSENWLECSGEILSGHDQFATRSVPNGAPSFVVSSTPHGGGTTARILFQSLISSAHHTIRITTPYFLPDRSVRAALIDAVRERGVSVQILTAGPKIDHPFVRTLSMQSSRHMLEAGAEIFEYQPSMIHAKLLTIDAQWSVLGSANVDHRSFALNDEINLAVLDRDLAAVIERDFEEDLQQSSPLTLGELKRRAFAGWTRPLIHGFEQSS